MFTNVAQRLNYFQKILQTFPRQTNVILCVLLPRSHKTHTSRIFIWVVFARLESCGLAAALSPFQSYAWWALNEMRQSKNISNK
jgi:hypothetical protein